MILDNYQQFLKAITTKLAELKIEVGNYELDHIGYQASSNADYDMLLAELDSIATRAAEVLVGGRRVSIYKLNQQLQFENYKISALEIVAPKDGQIVASSLEHVEFVINEDFTEFMAKYPQIKWDTSAIAQDNFPMVKLKLDDNLQVKFHKTNVLAIVKNNGL
jgi:predicted metalloenzyme YecM